MARFAGAVLCFVGAIAAIIFIADVMRQDHANRTYIEVPATIYRAEVITHTRHRGVKSYEAVAGYHYAYGDQNYNGRTITAISYGFSSASSLVTRIENHGGQIGPEGGWDSVAYVDPNHPERSILLRDYSFAPYGYAMAGLFGVVLGLGLAAGFVGPGRTEMKAVAIDDSEWRVLLPRWELRRELRNALFCFLVFTPAMLAMPAHWMLIAGQHDLQGGLAGLVASIIALALGLRLFNTWSVCRHVGDAVVQIQPAPLRRSETAGLKVSIDANEPLQVVSLKAHLTCTERTREKRGSKWTYDTRVVSARTIDLAGAQIIAAGQELSGQAELAVDEALPSSSNAFFDEYPNYTWELRVILALDNAPDYEAHYPVTVR